MNEKVYIIGKVTGLPAEEVRAKFNTREAELKEKGYEVVNPIKLLPIGADWNHAMRVCIKNLMDCTAISILDNWIDSNGGKLEWFICHSLNMKVVY